MTFQFTARKGDTYLLVQTYFGKTTIDEMTVVQVVEKAFVCSKKKHEDSRLLSFYRMPNKNGGHSMRMGKPFCQNALAFPQSKRKEAYAEFYKRGGKDEDA